MERSIVTEQTLVNSGCQDLANHAKKHTVALLSLHVAVFTWPCALPFSQERNCSSSLGFTGPRQKKGEHGRVGSHAYVPNSRVTTGQWGGSLPFQMVADGAGNRQEGRNSSPLHLCLPRQHVR